MSDLVKQTLKEKLKELKARYPDEPYYWLNVANDFLVWAEKYAHS